MACSGTGLRVWSKRPVPDGGTLLAVLAAVMLVGCSTVAIPGDTASASVVRAVAFDGGDIVYDGSHYHFRAANGIQMLSMWTPPHARPIRGVFISGNPGGIGGDNRRLTRDAGFQAFAARHDFALMGLHSFPGGMVYEEGAQIVLNVMNDFAAMGYHPEIANLPFITFGNSNGGITSYAMVCSVPERAICFTMNVGPRFNPPVPSDAAIKVPGTMVVGPNDPFFRTGVEDTRQLIHAARARGARWAWVAEQGKGHEVGRIFDFNAKFYENCIRMRLPDLDEPGGNPLEGPVRLREVALESGWLVDDESWEGGITTVTPYAEYAGDRATAGWLPDRDAAYLYRGLATYSNPLRVSIRDLAAIANPHASGPLLTEVGGHVVDPGARLIVEADVDDFPDWTKIEFYNGGAMVGEVARADHAEGKPGVAITVEPEPSAYSFTVLGYDTAGRVRTATPQHFTVGDPAIISRRPVKTLAVRKMRGERAPYGSAASRGAPASAARTAPDPRDAVLLVYALTPEQERQFRADDGRMTPFWGLIGPDHDRIELTVADSGAQDNRFSQEGATDAALIVKAARSAAGLYLYFEATDDGWVDTVRGPNMYASDCADILLDNRSSTEIWDAPRDKSFVNAAWSLSVTTVQLQVGFGRGAPPDSVRYCWADPFEFRYYPFTRSEVKAARGITFDFETIGETRKAQEWFIPWEEVGLEGLDGEPPMGRQLAFTAGYNDQDPGQHRGGAFDKLRWINRTSPWQAASYQGVNETWGNLEMGPVLGARGAL